MKAKILIDRRAECPACSTGYFTISHEPGTYGPWGCDVCGACYMFDITADDVEITRQETSDIPAWLVVKIEGSDPAVYMVVDSPFYAHSAEKTVSEQRENTRHWVEEHTCPTNLVRVEAIVNEGDADPHGVLEFVAHVPKPHWSTDEPEGGWAAMIDAAIAEG